MTTESKKTIQFAVVAALALGAPLEDGAYGGIITKSDGCVCAVVYLGTSESVQNHAGCVAYAAERGGELASRAVFHLLRSTIKDQLPKEGWCFTPDLLNADTGDESDASCAWYCSFYYGHQLFSDTVARGAALAVRLIHLEV